jgi:hypothetical protein
MFWDGLALCAIYLINLLRILKRGNLIVLIVLSISIFVIAIGYIFNIQYYRWVHSHEKRYCYQTYWGPANPVLLVENINLVDSLALRLNRKVYISKYSAYITHCLSTFYILEISRILSNWIEIVDHIKTQEIKVYQAFQNNFIKINATLV